jgi:hypothetical protein
MSVLSCSAIYEHVMGYIPLSVASCCVYISKIAFLVVTTPLVTWKFTNFYNFYFYINTITFIRTISWKTDDNK